MRPECEADTDSAMGLRQIHSCKGKFILDQYVLWCVILGGAGVWIVNNYIHDKQELYIAVSVLCSVSRCSGLRQYAHP